MTAIRPVARAAAATAAAAARSSSSTTITTTAAATALAPARFRYFSTTPRRAGGGGMQYDPPTGWLWGVRPGEKYQNEGWEGPFFYGFWGSLIVFAVAYAWKPDTSIQTWALEEARRRLEAEGILEDPEVKK
ncbi:ESSS subunit of NADH:ubiquinone oxidoreductase-domain-containing protein [Chaetomidium leptoderma]|uniref:NADH dehydrogenase [ubiquinone] 1 beta subcomplex subunit 11, mitochondrial n=1 Tax=Chaetomidium leptoderma TaxID=669021 RepID=A0AAN6VXK2_9PEZI|nr:ESSS subunit of NADH:ubiquinone oxidoreductase-domain-containing protein [Chaetomidium leptoderma]